MYIIFVDTGKPLSKREAKGVYATIRCTHAVRKIGMRVLTHLDISCKASSRSRSWYFCKNSPTCANYSEFPIACSSIQPLTRCTPIVASRITLWGITRLGQCDRTGDLQGAGVCHWARAPTAKSVYVNKYREELNVDGIKCYCIISAKKM